MKKCIHGERERDGINNEIHLLSCRRWWFFALVTSVAVRFTRVKLQSIPQTQSRWLSDAVVDGGRPWLGASQGLGTSFTVSDSVESGFAWVGRCDYG